MFIGCPHNAVAHGDKCYGVYTVSNLDTKLFEYARDFCIRGLTHAGKLIVPVDGDENTFVQSLAKLTE